MTDTLQRAEDSFTKATNMIIKLQDKNVKLKLAIADLYCLLKIEKQHLNDESWAKIIATIDEVINLTEK